MSRKILEGAADELVARASCRGLHLLIHVGDDQALMVEITETARLDDLERTRGMLLAFTNLGIRIALDDFGIGYSISRR